jgi:hypothetical protein
MKKIIELIKSLLGGGSAAQKAVELKQLEVVVKEEIKEVKEKVEEVKNKVAKKPAAKKKVK